MPGQFNSPEGDLESIFVDDYGLIDQYAATGSLWLWGSGADGRIGDNTTGDEASKKSPVQTIAGGTNWNYLALGAFHTVSIKADGTLWLWGRNDYGQLGDNTITHRSSPVQTIAGGTNWKQVSCGLHHTAAIKTDGTLWTWGRNDDGELGQNVLPDRSSPVQTITGGTNWKSVSCGERVTAAIKTDGTLWLWGYNEYGQLGNGTAGSFTHKSSPVQTIAGGTNWKSVSVGNSVAAIKTDGTLWTWGHNSYGQLGDNTTIDKSSPVQTIAGGTNWKSLIGDTRGHVLAIKTDGTLWAWGWNIYGQLGDNTTIDKSSPVQTIAGGTNWKQASYHYQISAAIKTDGTLWLWGYGSRALGDNISSTTHRSSPIQTIAGGTNWKSVSTGLLGAAAIYFYDANNQYPNS